MIPQRYYGKPVETVQVPISQYEHYVLTKRLNGYKIISVDFDQSGTLAKVQMVYLHMDLAD